MHSQEPFASLPASPSRFARCNRWQALLVLVLFLGATGWCLTVAATRPIMPAPTAGNGGVASNGTAGDAEFYRVIVRRVRAGENYYDAVAAELHARHYTPHSVFNWRPPLYAWLFGKLPSPLLAWGVLLLLVLTALGLTFQAVRAEGGPGRATAAVVLLLGPLAWCFFADIALFAELWAGVLILLSVAALTLDRHRLGWLAALLALGFRELALPYYLLAALWACRRRPRECVTWLLGLVLYAGYMAMHVRAASSRLSGTDVVHAGGWVQFGGTAFVLLTTQINFFLILLPGYVTALYLPLALLGLISWRGRAAWLATGTAGTFLAAFSIIGMWPHNAYWGLVYAPLLPLGLVWTPTALGDLWTALRPAKQWGEKPRALLSVDT